jgi:hypothetical protein
VRAACEKLRGVGEFFSVILKRRDILECPSVSDDMLNFLFVPHFFCEGLAQEKKVGKDLTILMPDLFYTPFSFLVANLGPWSIFTCLLHKDQPRPAKRPMKKEVPKTKWGTWKAQNYFILWVILFCESILCVLFQEGL